MAIKVYNTLTEKKEFLPRRSGKPVRFFVCGPTVYDFSHIGHAKTYLAFDVIVRYLRNKKIPVFYLQNITDIDDKIIHRAQQQNKKPVEIAATFTRAYLEDMKKLGVTSVTKYASASKSIPAIQNQISVLIKKGYAYPTSSGIYFEVKKFSAYGKLSRQNLDALRPGYRIEIDSEKKDPLDFALWKFKREPHEPSWPSPWGEGRPGWHIEDTAISEKYFGQQYELHGGAVDLKFPHHESEIAQQEAASGKKPFVKIWLHTGFLLINGEKMAKSLNNFITIRDFLAQYSPEVLRFIIVSHHYRSPLDFKPELAMQASQSLFTLKSFCGRLGLARNRGPISTAIKKLIQTTNQGFDRAMEDDFNTPNALATLFQLTNQTSPQIWTISKKEAGAIRICIIEKMNVLGFAFKKTAALPKEIQNKAKQRELFRVNKQFTHADALRKELEALGYIIEDTPQGPFVFRKE